MPPIEKWIPVGDPDAPIPVGAVNIIPTIPVIPFNPGDIPGILTSPEYKSTPPGDSDTPMTITWPGVVTLQVSADTTFAVVYDELAEAFCVEPQSGPPDGPNTAPQMVRPGAPLAVSTVWAWG